MKVPISPNPFNDHAIVGSFYFKSARVFLDAADRMIRLNHRVNNEFYVDQCMNEVVESGRKAHIFDVDKFVCWGRQRNWRGMSMSANDDNCGSNRGPELSIILPCYNEEKNISDVLRRYAAVLSGSGINAELVLVDNGSTDNSAQVISNELKNSDYFFARTVKVDKNIGYGFGVLSGLRNARGESLAYSHADQQCDAGDVIAAYKN